MITNEGVARFLFLASGDGFIPPVVGFFATLAFAIPVGFGIVKGVLPTTEVPPTCDEIWDQSSDFFPPGVIFFPPFAHPVRDVKWDSPLHATCDLPNLFGGDYEWAGVAPFVVLLARIVVENRTAEGDRLLLLVDVERTSVWQGDLHQLIPGGDLLVQIFGDKREIPDWSESRSFGCTLVSVCPYYFFPCWSFCVDYFHLFDFIFFPVRLDQMFGLLQIHRSPDDLGDFYRDLRPDVEDGAEGPGNGLIAHPRPRLGIVGREVGGGTRSFVRVIIFVRLYDRIICRCGFGFIFSLHLSIKYSGY